MEKNIFSLASGQIRTTFGVPYSISVNPTQKTAITSGSEHFIGLATVLAEGNVAPEYAQPVLEKLYEAQLLFNQGVAMGWQNGTAAKGQA